MKKFKNIITELLLNIRLFVSWNTTLFVDISCSQCYEIVK